MEQSIFVEFFNGNPMMEVVDYFLDNKPYDVTVSDVIRGTDLSRVTVFNYVRILEKRGIIKITRKVGKSSMYALNVDNPLTRKLMEIEMILIKKEFEHVEEETESRVAARVM